MTNIEQMDTVPVGCNDGKLNLSCLKDSYETASLTYSYDLQMCFTNKEFIVQICNKKCYFPSKLTLFFKGNSIFTTNLDYKFLICEAHL